MNTTHRFGVSFSCYGCPSNQTGKVGLFFIERWIHDSPKKWSSVLQDISFRSFLSNVDLHHFWDVFSTKTRRIDTWYVVHAKTIHGVDKNAKFYSPLYTFRPTIRCIEDSWIITMPESTSTVPGSTSARNTWIPVHRSRNWSDAPSGVILL